MANRNAITGNETTVRGISQDIRNGPEKTLGKANPALTGRQIVNDAVTEIRTECELVAVVGAECGVIGIESQQEIAMQLLPMDGYYLCDPYRHLNLRAPIEMLFEFLAD